MAMRMYLKIGKYQNQILIILEYSLKNSNFALLCDADQNKWKI